MRTFCVYYDLKGPGNQYGPLISYLEHFENFAQAGTRIWFINSDSDSTTILNAIKNLNILVGDSVIVFAVSNDLAAIGLQPSTSEWINQSWTP